MKSSVAFARTRLPTVGALAFQEDEALRIRRAMYGYRRRAAHPLTALDNPGVDIAFACFTRALVPERCGAPCPNSIATCFPRERKSDCSRALSVARSPNSSRASGPPTRSSVSNWNCGAHGARGRENSTRSGAPSWRKSRRPRKRVQSGSESKSADRSIAPSGLRPTKALNSEGGRFRLDRNTGRRSAFSHRRRGPRRRQRRPRDIRPQAGQRPAQPPLRRQRNHECAAPPTGCGIHSRHHRTFRRRG